MFGALKRAVLWLWYRSPLHRHKWFVQVTYGAGWNLKTGEPVEFSSRREFCLHCKKPFPRE